MNQHPNPERLRQWLNGRLSETESQEIYAHVTKCPNVCTTILDRLAKDKAPTTVAGLMTLRPGARPLPDYELVRKLGEGGFGEVWLARGPGGIEAALKFIRLEARGSALEVRSLDLMKSIRHPNLVSLFGAWQIDKMLILAMELCDRSLKDRLDETLTQKRPGIPVRELLSYIRDAANGLDALNEQYVQHRDVKPANLLLQHKGVKVADFGLAKVLEQSVASNTGAMTPAYTTPECFKGTVAKQSDQYSLAVTYFHLRTGRLLFEGNFHQIAYAHMNASPDLTGLPAAEQAALGRALSKEPDKRWRNCKAFVNELIKGHNVQQAQASKESALEAVTEPKRSGKLSSQQAKLLAQPTVLPTPSMVRADDARTKPQSRGQLPKARILGYASVLILGLVLLVACGGIVGALSLGMGPLSNRKGTDSVDKLYARAKPIMESGDPDTDWPNLLDPDKDGPLYAFEQYHGKEPGEKADEMRQWIGRIRQRECDQMVRRYVRNKKKGLPFTAKNKTEENAFAAGLAEENGDLKTATQRWTKVKELAHSSAWVALADDHLKQLADLDSH